ncbi:glucans biosynthesis glucosyltransferase MdoH [Phreatobacter aquaticus]|uniref:Glucans biosynthesis glucosyltransferase H n=1 Tax=Phreatobacter aquaticus TaxID=2570229 RepID=A0A4D7QDY3_9HYPH|nr:glucans biosynthesis glucosyltransferase MdoH [Phreatobacter aquaticus]QCK84681.1 glucans biosynthesis glucosyltransferase MdoH [Phreatobacter aquaticus]
MNDQTPVETKGPAAGADWASGQGSTTPAGLQSMAELRNRRIIVVVLNVATWFLLNYAAWSILSAGGWTLVDMVLATAFAVATPWTVLGFWNALIGLWLLHGVDDGFKQVAPFAEAGETDTPITIRTAVFMTLRNEDPARALHRLKVMKQSLDATGQGDRFDYFILSDTNDADVAIEEENLAEAFSNEAGPGRVVYRRRTDNAGFKAGNVREFCDRWGSRYELMLPLDADSLMAGRTIVRHVRMMQAYPKIGILQSLVVGMPSNSAFARMFQFGMRQGMRSYTMGQAWWVGECGPFWGHNALVRIKPFVDHCALPLLEGPPPFGGHVLSHDQVEATFMRRAGYEVRVLPEEGGSWEENPPTILEFSRRDVRWCQGNMQYVKLLDQPELFPMSRFQLIWAILMFVGVPAWTLMIALSPFLVWHEPTRATFPVGLGIATYLAFFAMYLMPKIAGFTDILITEGAAARYGGRAKFLLAAAIELFFSFLVGALTSFRITVFMVGLAFGKSVTWGGQQRDAMALTWDEAWAAFWPQMAFGFAVVGLLWLGAPAAAWWSLPLTLGFLVAIPFAVITASPKLGQMFVRNRLCGIPEEFETPDEIAAARTGA